MSPPEQELSRLIAVAQGAVRDALARTHAVRGWERLHVRDEQGRTRGPLPYTDEAIQEFTLAHRADPEDIGIVHHLAIAHHARAWDRELQGHPAAAQEWESALSYWRMVAFSGPFWAALQEKLKACDARASSSLVEATRRRLLESLLEIHVAFIRRYCEANEPQRAESHVALVRRANLPPAVRERLTARVFDAMTAAAPQAIASGEHAAALEIVERFLAVFPEHLPALRMHAEVCSQAISGKSYADHWEQIVALSGRALPCAERLAGHPERETDPLAAAAVEELATAMAMRGHDKFFGLIAGRQYDDLSLSEQDEQAAALELTLAWSELGRRVTPANQTLTELLAVSLVHRAYVLDHRAWDALRSTFGDDRTRATTATKDCLAAKKSLDRARELDVDNAPLRQFIDDVGRSVAHTLEQLNRFSLTLGEP